MIVPITKGANQPQPSAQMPSETNLLMALGVMHKNGYFNQPKTPSVKPIAQDTSR